MSRKGNAQANSVAESIFGSLKTERVTGPCQNSTFKFLSKVAQKNEMLNGFLKKHGKNDKTV